MTQYIHILNIGTSHQETPALNTSLSHEMAISRPLETNASLQPFIMSNFTWEDIESMPFLLSKVSFCWISASKIEELGMLNYNGKIGIKFGVCAATTNS